jgi:hypothetical protein
MFLKAPVFIIKNIIHSEPILPFDIKANILQILYAIYSAFKKPLIKRKLCDDIRKLWKKRVFYCELPFGSSY